MTHPKQLTLRGFDEEVAVRLERVAKERGISLNRAALFLIRRGLGLDTDEPARNTVGDSLDWMIGSLSGGEAREVRDAVRDLSVVDEDLWR